MTNMRNWLMFLVLTFSRSYTNGVQKNKSCVPEESKNNLSSIFIMSVYGHIVIQCKQAFMHLNIKLHKAAKAKKMQPYLVSVIQKLVFMHSVLG